MKRILVIMLVVLLALSMLVGCGSDASDTTTKTTVKGTEVETPSDEMTIYLITMDKMDQHWVSVNAGAELMAESLGINYKWDAPDVKDNAKQIESLNNAVADNADLIMLAANDPTAISGAVQDAIDKGVMIMYVDSGADVEAIATLSTNNLQAGDLAGNKMVSELQAAGKTSGTIGIVSVNTATNSTIARENGFRAVVEAAGYTILTTEYKDGDAAASQEAATGFISGNSDLVGIYGTNEGSSVGVGNAIKASSKELVGVGFDKSDAIVGLLDDGSLKAAMAQNPFTMGYLGVAQAYAALNGASTGPAVIDTGVAVLTSATAGGSTSDAAITTDVTVYLITMDKMDQHWVSVNAGAELMADALGINYKWDAPDVKDNAKQIESLNNAVADNADLIMLAANDPTAISGAVQDAIDKGVMIMYVDSGADVEATATLSTNNLQAGVLAGNTMIAELQAIGKTSGSIGIVSVNTATNSTIARENGFRSVVSAAGYTILTTEYKDGDAAASQEAATGFITGNSDLVGLYGTNEGSAVGVGNAVKASSKELIGIGFDKSDAIVGLLNDGSLKAAMAQNPFTMGYLGVAQAFAALNGQSTGPAVIDTGVAVLRGE